MKRQIDREIGGLKKNLLLIGTAVEEALGQAFQAVLNTDLALASRIIEDDKKIDDWELEIESQCLKLLSHLKPEGRDLQFIVSVLKINNDLERVGDLAANLANLTHFLTTKQGLKLPEHLTLMVNKVGLMVSEAIRSFIEENKTLAFKVTGEDSEIDKLHRTSFEVAESEIMKNPENTRYYLCVISLSRHLERIADHATNIAEDVIYMLSGKIIRHYVEKYFND